MQAEVCGDGGSNTQIIIIFIITIQLTNNFALAILTPPCLFFWSTLSALKAGCISKIARLKRFNFFAFPFPLKNSSALSYLSLRSTCFHFFYIDCIIFYFPLFCAHFFFFSLFFECISARSFTISSMYLFICTSH